MTTTTITIDRDALVQHLTGLNKQNWGMWPAASTWPSFGVDYTATQHAGPVTVAKFDRPVRVGGRTGTRFAVGDPAAIRRLGIKHLIALS